MIEIVAGVEYRIGSVRGARRYKPVIIPLSPAERGFLLYRLADRTASIECVLHAQRTGHSVSPWDRDTVHRHLDRMIDALRRGRDLIAITELDKLLIVQAIEQNGYFAQMHGADPRLSIDAVKRADALRGRLAAMLARPIGKIPLGAGRTRLKEPQHGRPACEHDRVRPEV